ncbi:MAG: alginate lyase family protein [Ignavibacteriales bacterium]|nr:MAG: alginate lyase family protein [Ignavibacteriales bacterium]
MALSDYLTAFNYNYLRQKLFRREVEASAFSGKRISMPSISTKTLPIIFKEKYPLRFFDTPQEKEKIVNAILSSEEAGEILKEAEKVVSNIYDVCCSGETDLGEEINWHCDFKSGFVWNVNLTWRYDYYSFPDGTDLKVPWELARFHQLNTLGKAYLISSDERYTEKYISLIKSFVLSNRFCHGINWLNTSEVAIRLINLAFSFSFFIGSELIDDSFIQSFNDLLLHHSLFIDNNLNYSSTRDSSYIINLLALGTCGLIYHNDYYGKKLLRFSQTGLEYEIRSQFYDDGVNREQSVPLHSVVLEALYLFRIILNKSGQSVSKKYDETLIKIFEVLRNYLREDNSVPQIGDSVTSGILPLSLRKNEHSHFSIAAKLYPDHQNFHLANVSVESVLLLGTETNSETIPDNVEQKELASKGFINGGHYILRNKSLHFFIEAGEIGNSGKGAPGHNDTFTFELFYKKKKFIVDSGTYSFYANPELRNRLRSVRSHNTAYIDDQLLSEFDGLFRIKEDLTKPKIIQWISSESEDVLSAQHYAYTRLADPVICKRTFHSIKKENRILIRDEFIGGTEHKVVLNFHLHPEVMIYEIDENSCRLESSGEKIILKILSDAVNKTLKVNESVYSEKYGCLQNSKKITFIMKEQLAASVETEINLL